MDRPFTRTLRASVLFMLLAAGIGRSQWEMLPGRNAGSIRSLFAIGSTLFAGADHALLRSGNHGDSWTSDTSAWYPIIGMAQAGDSLFKVTSEGQLFRSGDTGFSWIPVDTGLLVHEATSLISDGSTLFEGTKNGVLRSTDNGKSWTQVGNAVAFKHFNCLLMHGGYLFGGTYGGGVYRADGHGEGWTSRTTGLAQNRVVGLAGMGTSLFAATTDSGVFRSGDDGETWTPANTGLTDTRMECLAVSGNLLFAGTAGGGVFQSRDYGVSWTSTGPGLPGKTVTSLTVLDSNLYAGTYDSHVYRLPLAAHGTGLRRTELGRRPGAGFAGRNLKTSRFRIESAADGAFRVDAKGRIMR